MDTALPQKFPFILDRNLAINAACVGHFSGTYNCTAKSNVLYIWHYLQQKKSNAVYE